MIFTVYRTWIRGLCWVGMSACWATVASADLDSIALTEVKGILRSRCLECHRAEASSTDFDVLDVESLIKSKTVAPGDADGSALMRVITTDDPEVRMPQDLPALPAEEIEKIRRWIAGGAKAFPEDVQRPEVQQQEDAFAGLVGVEYVLKQILAHQRKQKPDHQRYIRYFSCNHLLTRGATRDELNLQRDALAKTINHLTYERDPVELEIIDGETATVFAVDIRKLGWHADVLKASDSFLATKSSLDKYDLILLEYPYGIGYEDSETYDRLEREFLKPSEMVRQIPYLRSDWFCSTALQPVLYHDIMGLPHTVSELERDIIGVDADEELHHERIHRGAVILSGVSRNNRAAERYSAPHGAYWKSIDYSSNVGSENIFRDPVDLHGVGGEMIFNLPNGLQGYYLADAAGNRLDAGPTAIVTDKFAEDKVVRNALSCVRCHDKGIKPFKDVVRPAIESLPGHLGFNKKQVLALYPEQDELSALLKKDTDRFLGALEKVLGRPQSIEPLVPVTRRYLEDPLLLGTVAGELGLEDSEDMAAVFRSRQFTSLGLLPLASKGAIRRDTWEDYFDQVVHQLGLGKPVVPLDAISRRNYAPLGVGPDITLTTTRGTRLFGAGDKIAILVKNNGKLPIFIELIGTSTRGENIVLVPAGTKLSPGQEHRFPEEGTLTVKAATGQEFITVFSSDQSFVAGTRYHGKHTADRYVHDLSTINTAPIVKKTLVIETR
ncbi:c-type cytochrome domain-containing protein [Neorhodopirellula pilleata]|uniref:Planctomycete cytochrome C n=1 Tax=Neorhodopirellula pilleata TaxID=2714738 RepID=A0A5C5ZXJ1_9BACT|nr:c-type cytochrome domain-containing protein [Neorhodopirellula pilleata]TWT91870.1 Planctomycete cytochrome C [Neorhodopirellula pilleata]